MIPNFVLLVETALLIFSFANPFVSVFHAYNKEQSAYGNEHYSNCFIDIKVI